MTSTTQEAFDAVSWSETLLSRMTTASAELSHKQGFKEEKAWLGSAIERLSSARAGLGEVLSRAMRLEELEALREDWARSLQQAALDSVERLEAGITFHAGTRAPLLEALFAKLKLPPLRRASREDFEKFAADFEKRLGAGYVKRMLADPTFEVLTTAVDQVRATFTAWRQAFSPQPLPPEEAEALREELQAQSKRLELPVRQARLLAEAALAPVRNAFEESGIGQRPKRRAPRPVEISSAPAAPTPEVLPEREPTRGKAPRVKKKPVTQLEQT